MPRCPCSPAPGGLMRSFLLFVSVTLFSLGCTLIQDLGGNSGSSGGQGGAPMCLPDGSMCMTDAGCCSQACIMGTCGGGQQCLPSASACMTDADCCSQACVMGTCGG